MNKRESTFEVLRILCIVLIIAFHYVIKAGFEFGEEVTGNKILMDVFYHFGELGVNCFILISGYFYDVTYFRWKKIGLIIFQLWFYLILGRGILAAIGDVPLRIWKVSSFTFPILKGTYWFVTVYVLIYILVPYFKKLVMAISKKEFQRLILVQIAIWSVYPTIILGLNGSNNTEGMPYYSRYVWLIVVYLIGAYIKTYGLEFIGSLKKAILFEALLILILGSYIFIAEKNVIAIMNKPAYYFWPPNSILQILLSVGLFSIFSNLKITYHKTINYIASCTLGIYMLHDGELASFWWQYVFKNATHQNQSTLILFLIQAVIVIMAIGIILESIRKIIEVPIKKVFDFLEIKVVVKHSNRNNI